MDILRSPEGEWWITQAKDMDHGGKVHLVGIIRFFPTFWRGTASGECEGRKSWEYRSLCGGIFRGGIAPVDHEISLPLYDPTTHDSDLCRSCARSADLRDMTSAEDAVRMLKSIGVEASVLGPESVLLYAKQVRNLVERLRG